MTLKTALMHVNLSSNQVTLVSLLKATQPELRPPTAYNLISLICNGFVIFLLIYLLHCNVTESILIKNGGGQK
jgi:hypothetical protein